MTSDNYQSNYGDIEPARAEIDALKGPTVLEFGAPDCSYCKWAQPNIQAVIRDNPAVKHLKIEDGSGRPLGRSFQVRLWPTLVVLKDGVEVARAVRPSGLAEIKEAVAKSL